jgi:hypothetical protein
VEGVTGKYFEKKKPVTPDKGAREPDVQRRLWEASEALVKASAAAAA